MQKKYNHGPHDDILIYMTLLSQDSNSNEKPTGAIAAVSSHHRAWLTCLQLVVADTNNCTASYSCKSMAHMIIYSAKCLVMMTKNHVTGLCAFYTGIYHGLGVLPVIKANVCYKAVFMLHRQCLHPARAHHSSGLHQDTTMRDRSCITWSAKSRLRR